LALVHGFFAALYILGLQAVLYLRNPYGRRVAVTGECWIRPAEPRKLLPKSQLGVPIPPAATEVYGITNADVARAPRFADVPDSLLAFLDGRDPCRLNLKRYDRRLLHAELVRVDKPLSLQGRAIVDAIGIFLAYEKRGLAAAVCFYCDSTHEKAHSAGADVQATAEVLDAMLGRYGDLPRAIAGLHQHFKDPNAVDSNGCFVRVTGQVQPPLASIGDNPPMPLTHAQPDHRRSMLDQDFFDDIKAIVPQALAGCRGL
jgi:DNA polymerase III epsilon subunit-like protein